MALYPPQLQFTVDVIVEQRVFLTKNGSGVWEEISRLEIGPRKKVSLSDSHVVNIATRYYLFIITLGMHYAWEALTGIIEGVMSG